MDSSTAQVLKDEASPKTADDSKLTAASALTSLSTVPNMAKSSEDEEDEEFLIPQRFTKSGRKRAVPFPLKLMKVLSNKEYSEIIAWMPTGKSFNILKPKAFVAEILPGHFKSAKYSSFTRKLHRWGFMRHYRGEEAGAFYHELFQKDRLDLVEKMTCHKAEPPKILPKILPQVRKPERVTSPQVCPPRIPKAAAAAVPPPPAPQSPIMECNQMDVSDTSQDGFEAAEAAAERLNAAIEVEVSRRLKERITAATLSRQKLAMMRAQMNSQVSPPAISEVPTFTTWGSAGIVNPMSPALLLRKQILLKQALLKQALLQEAWGNKSETRCDSTYTSATPLTPEGQPRRNVQGAKTA